MKIVTGGAFQGKLDYAKGEYGGTVYDCGADENREKTTLDFSCSIINGLEYFTRACCRQGIEASDYLRSHIEELWDTVILCTDISQGLVPMDSFERDWREMTGRAMIYLVGEADSVERIFCGLAQKIK